MTSSARPAALRAYAAAAARAEEALARRSEPLQAALAALRRSAGWPDAGDVPPLDVDYGVARARLARLRAFVDQVAAGFEAAGADAGGDGSVRVADRRLGRHVRIDLHERVSLLPDGDRWIHPGTSGDDIVRVVRRDGATYLEVGVVVAAGGRRRLGWTARRLTGRQAAGLVIRTGGGNDWLAVSPEVRTPVTAWMGAGDDVYGWPGEHHGSRLGGGGGDDISTGPGDDRVEGGAGDDRIDTGPGDDYADGQDGGDVIVSGPGGDVVYGGRGDDRVEAGPGADHLEGGRGRDLLRAGAGADIVSGGRGADILRGGRGDDALLGGRGADAVAGGEGRDTATAEGRDHLRQSEVRVTVELGGDPGSYAVDLRRPEWMTGAEWDAWVERLDADLELLRSTTTGRRGLAALDRAARDSDDVLDPFDADTRLRIVPHAPLGDGDLLHRGRSPEPVGFDAHVAASLDRPRVPGDKAGAGLARFDRSYAFDAWVSYAPANVVPGDYGPPVLTLQHELSHAWDHLHRGRIDVPGRTYTETRHLPGGGTADRVAPRPELNAVGFDLDGDGDIDTVAAGDGQPHPAHLTENALRDELGLRRRTSYRWGTFAGDDRVTYGDTGD